MKASNHELSEHKRQNSTVVTKVVADITASTNCSRKDNCATPSTCPIHPWMGPYYVYPEGPTDTQVRMADECLYFGLNRAQGTRSSRSRQRNLLFKQQRIITTRGCNRRDMAIRSRPRSTQAAEQQTSRPRRVPNGPVNRSRCCVV